MKNSLHKVFDEYDFSEEQKNQIENLKNQLKSAQGQIGLSISNSLPSSEKLQLKMTEKENEIQLLKKQIFSYITFIQRIYFQKLQIKFKEIIDKREKIQRFHSKLLNGKLKKRINEPIKK